MKIYTDLEQSEKLSKILPLETADMALCSKVQPLMTDYISAKKKFSNAGEIPIDPCWSLAALLNVLPKIYYPVKDHKTDLILGKPKDKWCVLYWDSTGMQDGEEAFGDNPVDACVNMIVKLKELNLL